MLSTLFSQPDLFGSVSPLPQLGDFLDYRPDLFSPEEASRFMQELIGTTRWEQTSLKIQDRVILSPRLSAWFGDDDAGAFLNEKFARLHPWTDTLQYIREKVEPLTGRACNSVLLNYYRDQQDSVAWHRDKSARPGKRTLVGSVSFGEPRNFEMRRFDNHSDKTSLRLAHGSFLLMKTGFQEHWEHRVAKSTRAMGPRLNLTFRVIGPDTGE